MKKLRKACSMLMACTMAAALLGGCNEEKTGKNETGSPAGQETAEIKTETREEKKSGNTVEPDAQVILTYWGWDSNFYKPLMEAFQKEHPNVEFEITEVASGDYVTKVQQCIASGTELPDILASEVNYRGQMLNIDMWEDLTQSPYDLTDDMFFESSLSQMKNKEGKILCVDETVCPSAFAYKRDLAKKYFGTDDPDELSAMLADVDSICEAAQKVQKESGGAVKLFPTVGGVMEWLRNKEAVTLVNEKGEVDFTGKYQQTLIDACKLRDAGAIDVIEWWSAQENAAYGQSNHILFPAANWSIEFSIKPNDLEGSATGECSPRREEVLPGAVRRWESIRTAKIRRWLGNSLNFARWKMRELKR